MLITHFDVVPSGQEIWLADKNGGISHCDMRQRKEARRRWVVQEEGRAAKLGGLSINRELYHPLPRRTLDPIKNQLIRSSSHAPLDMYGRE